MNPEAWRTIRWIVVVLFVAWLVKIGLIDKMLLNSTTKEIVKHINIDIGK